MDVGIMEASTVPSSSDKKCGWEQRGSQEEAVESVARRGGVRRGGAAGGGGGELRKETYVVISDCIDFVLLSGYVSKHGSNPK
ncbi:hypothetical protein M0802_015527 [Mischocyttarus mexicanus]|nr:hypothetical protein M0802_015527 [Mischocyttarus mexicanus]